MGKFRKISIIAALSSDLKAWLTRLQDELSAAINNLRWQDITEGVRIVTGAYTLTSLEFTLLCDATGAAFTITLPAAASNHGRIYVIKKTDVSANAVTIDGNGAETIDGAATVALAAQYNARTIQSNGTNWSVLATV